MLKIDTGKILFKVLRTMKLYSKLCIDILIFYSQSLTPLHYSAMRGNDDAATDLLQIPTTNLEVSKNFLSKKSILHTYVY